MRKFSRFQVRHYKYKISETGNGVPERFSRAVLRNKGENDEKKRGEKKGVVFLEQ